MFAAWHVALSYSLQLYFDFSGYSDMAIGLARMFNVRFPLNFNSPYKARSVIEYWQRWHMTLTRYLNLCLYDPIALRITRRRRAQGLPVNRDAHATVSGFSQMVLLPTFVTMALAGIWHGSGLTFLVFGLLHAVYISVNHLWRVLHPRTGPDTRLSIIGQVLLTYLCVLVGAIMFRAPSITAACELLGGMIGLHGVSVAFGTVQMRSRCRLACGALCNRVGRAQHAADHARSCAGAWTHQPWPSRCAVLATKPAVGRRLRLRRHAWPVVHRRHRRISLLPVLTDAPLSRLHRSQRCCCHWASSGPGSLSRHWHSWTRNTRPGWPRSGCSRAAILANWWWLATYAPRSTSSHGLAHARRQPCRRRRLSDRGLCCRIARARVSDAATTRHRVIQRGAFHRAGPVLGTLGSLRFRARYRPGRSATCIGAAQ